MENTNKQNYGKFPHKYGFGVRGEGSKKAGRGTAEEPHIKRRRHKGRLYYYLAQGRKKEIFLGSAQFIYAAVMEKRAKIGSGEIEQEIEPTDEENS